MESKGVVSADMAPTTLFYAALGVAVLVFDGQLDGLPGFSNRL